MLDIQAFMTRLRAVCQALPESEEYLMHGHPSFRAGKKPFVIVGDGSEGYTPTMSVKVSLDEQPHYLEDPRFTRTHYIGQHGWITIELPLLRGDDEMHDLVVGSYRRVAPKRALKVLEAQRA